MQPDKKFKAGAISATVWENKQDSFSYFTVSLERNYKDKMGSWKTTNSMRINDLPKAKLALEKAYEYLVLKDAA